MNSGVLYKTIRESWRATLLFGLAIGLFHAILAVVLPGFFADMAEQFLDHPFLRNIIRGMLGPIGNNIGPATLLSFAWVHPVVLALMWAHEIVFCTRVPASEVDRGTIDVLLGLPVSRWSVYRTESAVWLGTGIVILTFGLCGNAIGTALGNIEDPPSFGRRVIVTANLFCMYVAVGGFAYLVSALSDRRGRAVGTVFGVVLFSFFLHVLAQFWEPAQIIGVFGLLTYYRPHEILQSGAWPVVDMLVLAGVGGAAWVAGGRIFAHRDICTT